MEKYIKLSDIEKVFNDLLNEPAYIHPCEDWHDGVYSAEAAVRTLPTVALEAERLGEWLVVRKGLLSNDYKCSRCGSYAAEGNSGCMDVLTKYCSNCGIEMKGV